MVEKENFSENFFIFGKTEEEVLEAINELPIPPERIGMSLQQE